MSDKREEVKWKDKLAEQVADIRFGNHQKYGRIANNLEVFDDLVEKAEDGYFSAEPPFETHIASELEDVGIIERVGSYNPRYHAEDAEAIREFEEAFREFDSRGWSKRDVYASLKAISKHVLEEEKISSKAMSDIKGAPHPRSVCRNYDSWNDAVFFAGLYPKIEEMGEEEVRERFRKKFYEVDGFPSRRDFVNDPSMPTREQVREEFGSYNELVESEFPYRLDRDERDYNHDVLETGNFDYDKWVAKDNGDEAAKAKT